MESWDGATVVADFDGTVLVARISGLASGTDNGGTDKERFPCKSNFEYSTCLVC